MRVAVFGMVLLASGCLSTVRYGSSREPLPSEMRVFLPPFQNATDDDHAGRALSEITASALMRHGVSVVQTEPALTRGRAEKAAGADGLYADAAQSLRATHLLIGTVHEYRYKTDLDGDPVVGLSLRLVEARTGRTLWQGTSSRVSVFFASLSEAAQKAADDLVRRVPWRSYGAEAPGAAPGTAPRQ